MSKMSKILMKLGLILGLSLSAVGQSATQGSTFMTAGTGTPLDFRGTAIMTHQLIWRPIGNVTSCSVQLDSSNDNVTWTSGGIFTSQTCTSPGQTSQLQVTAPFLRVNVTSFTGTGSLNVTYVGAWPQAIQLASGTTVGISGTPSVSLSGTPSVSVSNFPSTPTANPCANPAVVAQSAPIAITTATTTQLVAGVSGKQVFVCGFSLAMTGTILADSFQLEYGTGAGCTSPTVLTGPLSSGILTAGATTFAAPFALAPTAAGASLCAVTTVGTLPTIEGVVSYVQQ